MIALASSACRSKAPDTETELKAIFAQFGPLVRVEQP